MEQLNIDHLLFSDPFDPLAEYPNEQRELKLAHAPIRTVPLSEFEKKLAVSNALRYLPNKFHKEMSKEFAQELVQYGHIYAYRFMPNFHLKAPSLDKIRAKSKHSGAIILMIINNLDPEVAQFPQELVTYGGNGQVFSNWIQFRLTIRYLASMDDHQTVVMYSGHPMGLFPSHPDAPRVVITNGMMIPNYSTRQLYDKYFALGVTMYGQMTAGSYSYIGPQGIVHGTTITLMTAIRKYLGVDESPGGKLFVTSGLGGMSGAQAKAAVIVGVVAVIAEVNEEALLKRYKQNWLDVYTSSLTEVMELIRKNRSSKNGISIGYLGNVVDLWEYLALESENYPELIPELGSDQTSCHNPFNGGYYPVACKSVSDANRLMTEDNFKFVELVKESLRRQITAIGKLCKRGMHFWDYGNAFLAECYRAGANDLLLRRKDGSTDEKTFIYPSYMQHIMGEIFSLGFGPFRWVCTSMTSREDLRITDEIACETISKLIVNEQDGSHSGENMERNKRIQQYKDNLKWVCQAEANQLVVGSQARILYADHQGRSELALAFNRAIADCRIKGPIVISRDHHDVSGTDSPLRETSNIYDGSAYTADMAVQNIIGCAFRGATWVSIHNGGGVGWGDSINGGFGLILDGTKEAERRALMMLAWDVNNGVARRCWSSSNCDESDVSILSRETIQRAMSADPRLVMTMPSRCIDMELLESLDFGSK